MKTELLSKVTVWMDAHRSIPKYETLYSYVTARAGEGEKISPEKIGMTRRQFAFDELYLLEIPGGACVYSIDTATGELDVELLSNYFRASFNH